MANIKSAKKRINVTAAKTAQNKRVKTKIKELTKEFFELIDEKKKDEAATKFKEIEKRLMRAASHNVYKKNTVARKVSLLAKKLNAA
jgi:small subunit ribosomal protein S20